MRIPVRSLIVWTIACVALVSSNSTLAQSAGGLGLRPRDANNSDKARILGMLVHLRLTVNFDQTPARDAFAAIATALNINILGRWSDDKAGHGIDPDLPLTMRAEARNALEVVEELLEQCEDYEQCTWQLRSGFLEIGTKRRLAAPASRERITYDLTDLLFEPPNFGSTRADAGRILKNNSPYVDAVLGEANRTAIREGTLPPRKSKSELMLEIGEGLVEIIESGRWDLGQNDERPDHSLGPNAASQPAETPAEARARREKRYWASMRTFQEALIITAPDFMHRQIGGYPKPIVPLDADTVRVVVTPK